jgi:hypothetical protein
VQGCTLKQVVFPELFLQELDGKAGPEDGQIEFPEQEGQCPDMVFVAVSENDALELVFIVPQKLEIGDYDIHTGHVLLREHEPGIHNDGPAIVLQKHHVEADFAQPPQWYHFKHSVPLPVCGGPF